MEEKTLKEYGEKIKNELLSLDDVYSFVAALGGNPSPAMNGTFICDTICHNEQGEGSHKLYYYDNSHGFHCYTNCDYFDIFELVIKVKKFVKILICHYRMQLIISLIILIFHLLKKIFNQMMFSYKIGEYFRSIARLFKRKKKKKK